MKELVQERPSTAYPGVGFVGSHCHGSKVVGTRGFDDCFSMSTMSQRSHLTDSEAWRVGGRLEGGQTQDEVAQAIGVSQSVISRI
ncbi:hypothetical protein TNCV_3696821 [Trichonephila clavipes]|uniref:HTH cro/C1-type domain-containing protein n=1 Tax=Trichonephila clavipes TaxID=2585209 RepID=A0A8X6SEF2_TRICX|nr:hypothetical protein TNCV_3696821 [Trichonephila clavipes]